MTVIELPDEQAAASRAKAAAAGLSLEAWLNELASVGRRMSIPCKPPLKSFSLECAPLRLK
jgi:hypothetical protein